MSELRPTAYGNPAIWQMVSLFGPLVALFFDFVMPAGLNHGELYLLFVLTAALTLNSKFLFGVMAYCVCLIVVGFFISDQGELWQNSAQNRLISIIEIIVIGVIFSRLIHYRMMLLSSADELEKSKGLVQKQQVLLSAAAGESTIGGWAVDLETNQLYWSDAVRRIHGVEPGHTPGFEEALAFFAPEWRQSIVASFQACIENKIPIEEELEIINTAGERVWVRVVGHALRDESDKVIKLQGLFQEISNEPDPLQFLHFRRQFQLFSNAIPQMIWTAEPDGTVDFANQVLCDYMGLPLDLVISQWMDALFSQDRERAAAAWTEALQSTKEYEIELRIRRHDGSYRWHLVQATPVRTSSGSVIKWCGAAIDIHNIKMSNERFEILSQATADAVWDWDLNTDVVWWNKGMQRLFGHGDEKPSDSRSWTDNIHPEDKAAVLDNIDAAIAGPTGRWEGSYRFIRKDGTTAHVTDRGHIIRDADGKAIRMVGGMTDVTQKKELEDQLGHAQKLQSLGELTGGVAHDFNNLLTVIQGNVELLEEDLQDDEELLPLLQMTSKAAKRAAELTQRLLAFARRQQLGPQATDINKLVSGMESLLNRILQEDINVDLVHGEELWPAQVDASQLENALLNLCINSRDAMPEGGRLVIETRNLRVDPNSPERQGDPELNLGEYVVIDIKDTGTGMDENTVARAFDPFFTLKKAGLGTGLGLSMVYGFVKQSGGHAKIHSRMGEGTTVRLFIPRADCNPQEPRLAGSSQALGEGQLILLVEDNELVLEHAQRLLLKLNYQVISASNGTEAIDILRSNPQIQLLFTDIVMPGGMDGFQLAEQARQLRPDLKVLYTSGYSDTDVGKKGRLGSDVFLLSKPYEREDLARQLRTVLNERQE